MNSGYALRSIRQYQQVSNDAAMVADPHRLVSMLFDGAIERLTSAKGHATANAVAKKTELIRSAMAIIDGLRMSLNRDAGGEIAQNLDSLYDYMSRRLLEANLKNDINIIDEVIGLLREIKAGWQGIGDDLATGPATVESPRRQ